MADTHNEFDTLPDPDAKTWSLYSIPMVLAIGWIIFEVSHRPDIAAMVMCLKFGIEDFRTAFWLRRRDPWSERGRATSMLYLSSGMWKAAMTGIVMVFVILIVIALTNMGAAGNGVPGLPNNNHKAAAQAVDDIRSMIVAAFGATLIGQAIASLACARALSLARKHRIPLWLSGSLHFARHRNDWPPVYGYVNRLVWLNGCCFLFNWLIFTPLLSLFVGQFVVEVLKWPIPKGLFLFIFFFGYLRRAMALGNKHQDLGIFAQHPMQCWGKPAPVKPHADAKYFEEMAAYS